MESGLEAALLAVGAGVVYAAVVKANHTGVFMEILKERLRLNEVVSEYHI